MNLWINYACNPPLNQKQYTTSMYAFRSLMKGCLHDKHYLVLCGFTTHYSALCFVYRSNNNFPNECFSGQPFTGQSHEPAYYNRCSVHLPHTHCGTDTAARNIHTNQTQVRLSVDNNVSRKECKCIVILQYHSVNG